MWKPFYYISKGIFAPLRPLYPTKTVNKENIIKTGRYIYAGNHLSLLDIPLTLMHSKGLRRYIAKKEFLKNFFSKMLFTWFGCMYIDRDEPKLSEMRDIFNWLNGNGQIFIFPEGTRNKTDEETKMQPFKGGLALFAAKCDAPVLPVLMYKRSRLFKKNYLYYGKPIDIIKNKGRMPTSKEIGVYTARYELEFERERVIFDDIVANKRWKKKNKLADGEKCQSLVLWEAEHGYAPFDYEKEMKNYDENCT